MGGRVVILDIGGVLEHTPPTGWMHDWEQRLGLEPGGLERRIMPFLDAGELGTATYEEVEHEVAAALSLRPSGSEAFWEDMWTEYLGTLNEELLDYVGSLRPAYRVATLSNSFVGAREREEDAYGFSRHVDLLIYSHEEGLKKPDRAFYRLACERLEVEPRDVVFVDDHEPCVSAASDLGMRALRFTTNDTTIPAIRACLGPAEDAGGEAAPPRAPG